LQSTKTSRNLNVNLLSWKILGQDMINPSFIHFSFAPTLPLLWSIVYSLCCILKLIFMKAHSFTEIDERQ
jgi:hypothetical protein